MIHSRSFEVDLPLAVLDVIPNPVLVKNANLEYVWVNAAFEQLFSVRRADLMGRLDVDVFKDRQAAQCNGGDLRVLETGIIDEAHETVFQSDGSARETLTRKSRLSVPSGATYLVGVMHDLTDMMATQARLEEANARLEDQSRELRRLAETDGLTGCLNRRALFAAAGGVERAEPLGVLLLDLDHFKKFNDQFGHAAGDRALQHFVHVTTTQLGPKDIFARLGGEEFVVLLPGAESASVSELGSSIGANLRATPFDWEGASLTVTASIGGMWRAGGEPVDLDTALQEADRQLYCAKAAGRDRMVM